MIVVTLALSALALTPLQQAPSDDSVTVHLTVEMFTYDVTCEQMQSDSKTWDLPFAQVQVSDGSGQLLGTGRIDEGFNTDASCVFTDEFIVNKSPDGFYRIMMGDPDLRGNGLVYNEAEYMVDGELWAYMNVNDHDNDLIPDNAATPEGEGLGPPMPTPTADCHFVDKDQFPLERCDEGPAIAAAQSVLQILEYEIGTVDCLFGDQMVNALKAFQRHEGLPVTGGIDSVTWGALAASFLPGWGDDADGNLSIEPNEISLVCG